MRVEQAMAIVQDLLNESSDDDDLPPPPSPKRQNSKGWHLRRGGWQPEARQNPAAQGKAKWNHDWSKGFIYRLLQRVENDESGYWDGVHRARFTDFLGQFVGRLEGFELLLPCNLCQSEFVL